MSSYIAQVWNGWKNVFFETPEIEKMAEQRKLICDGCPIASKKFCSKYKTEIINGEKKRGCGCPKISIWRSVDYHCINGKW